MSRGSDATEAVIAEESRSGEELVSKTIPPFTPVTFDPRATGPRLDHRFESVYRPMADAMSPRWRRVLAAAPSALERKRPSSQARGLFHVTASALASAVSAFTRGDGVFDRSLVSAIESALVGWQLSHWGDGRPRSRDLKRDSLTVASTHHVVALLGECSQFRTSLLMGDLAAHLGWLRSCSGFPPWVEARVVASLAEGGALLGDGKLSAAAESRVKSLCTQGQIPGWNASRKCGDLSLVSATLDPLARTYGSHQWGCLASTLSAMGKLLEISVDRAGAIGGLRNILRLPFSLPYGIETMAKSGLGCLGIASLCRDYVQQVDASALLSWGEDLVATVGPSVALCLKEGTVGRLDNSTPPAVAAELRSLDDAGICIYQTESYDALVDRKRGGALRIRWSRNGQSQEDHGLRAVFDDKSFTSESIAKRCDVTEEGTKVIISGAFALDDVRVSSGLAAAGRRAERSPRIARRWFGLCASGDQYNRQIRFEPTRVIITDTFQLRAAADLVLVGANGLEDHPGALSQTQLNASGEDAVVLEDTASATITRVLEGGHVIRLDVSK